MRKIYKDYGHFSIMARFGELLESIYEPFRTTIIVPGMFFSLLLLLVMDIFDSLLTPLSYTLQGAILEIILLLIAAWFSLTIYGTMIYFYEKRKEKQGFFKKLVEILKTSSPKLFVIGIVYAVLMMISSLILFLIAMIGLLLGKITIILTIIIGIVVIIGAMFILSYLSLEEVYAFRLILLRKKNIGEAISKSLGVRKNICMGTSAVVVIGIIYILFFSILNGIFAYPLLRGINAYYPVYVTFSMLISTFLSSAFIIILTSISIKIHPKKA